MLNSAGKKLGASKVIMELESWHKKNLSKYKWLRGGIEVVEEVCVFFFFLSCFRVQLKAILRRSRNHPLVKYYGGFFKIDMS